MWSLSKHSLLFSSILLVQALAVLAISVKPAPACTCAAPAGPAEGLKKSSAVFRGRVIEITRPFWDRVGLTNSGGHRIGFTVTKQWKGKASNYVEVSTRLSGEACGFPFALNKEYLVYMVADTKDIQTGICTGTKNIADAEREMKQLDEIVAGGAR